MERMVRRSDVLFSLPKDFRAAAEKIMQSERPKTVLDLQRALWKRKVSFDREELKIFWNLTVSRVGHGDLYEFVTGTEELLHNQIRLILSAEFGEQELGWWRKGVPEKVRVACAQAREQGNDDDVHPYAYTTLIHLKEIIDRNWGLFNSKLPADITDKRTMLSSLEHLNVIRNRVMHPTRLQKITHEDFEFAREMHRKLRLEAWR
jgi:hypothetical protein